MTMDQAHDLALWFDAHMCEGGDQHMCSGGESHCHCGRVSLRSVPLKVEVNR
jgi:hypothetical protein